MAFPTVSILTTSYNCGNYLADCIESILASTYQDWELLIVDDHSTDGSVAIAQSYAAKDSRIKVFVNERNLGDYPNRNRAASLANGNYLKYVDADDMLYKHALEIMVESMEKFPEAALGLSDKDPKDHKLYPIFYTPAQTYENHFLNDESLGVGPSSVLIKREIFERLGGFSGKRFVGDTEFWLKVCSIYSLVIIQSGIVFKRMRSDQEFGLGHSNHEYTLLDYTVSKSALSSINCPLTPERREIALKWIEYRFCRNIINIMFIRYRVRVGMALFKKSKVSIFSLILSLKKTSIQRLSGK